MPPKRSILDLTVAQIEEIEHAVGAPFRLWSTQASNAALLRELAVAFDGYDRDEVNGWTMRQLVERVTVDLDARADADPNG